MTAYEQEMEALRERIGELEQSVANISMSMPGRDGRIEALEDNALPPAVRVELDDYAERLETLEEKATSVDCVRVHRDIAEDERQDRWHATRDAALPEAMRVLRGLNDDHEMADRAAIICGIVADRAHGPLEAKVTPHPDISIAGVTVGQVDTLVKAAKACFDWYEIQSGSVLQFEVLLNALKPFEAAK